MRASMRVLKQHDEIPTRPDPYNTRKTRQTGSWHWSPRSRSGIIVSPSTVLFSFQSWRQTWFHFHHGLSSYRSSLADLLFVNTRWYCDPGAPPLDLMAPGAQCHSSDAETIHCLRSSLEMMDLSHSKQQQGMAGSMRQGQHHSPRYDSVMSLEFLLCHTCRSALVLEVPIFVPPSLRTPYCLSIVGKMCVNYDSYLFRG